MSLQFYLGSAGSGKSSKLHNDIALWAKKEPGRNFLFIVPDQFTMQTQIDLVNASLCNGIMNIDVLSFGRLAYRIFEELGCNDQVVMDDTGKSLILRQLSGKLSEKMPVLGANLNKIGYVHEIKSVISEFKQYDVSPKKLEELISFSEGRGMLNAKLKDIKIIYEAFNEYTGNGFITSEETISILTERIKESAIVKDSVVIFDGFTGFTPVQYRLIEQIMEITNRVIFSITIDINDSPYTLKGEQELFALSRKTIYDLQKLAQGANIPQLPDVMLTTNYRVADKEDLLHLEKHIFRYPMSQYKDIASSITILEQSNPEEEVRWTCRKMKKLVLEEGYSYRDMAVICGEMGAYLDAFKVQASLYDIPVFIDQTNSFVLNPFVEYIRSALNLISENFSYQSVFHFLRSGMLPLDMDEIDKLDNYVLKCGIKGRKKWENVFSALPYKSEKDGTVKEENLTALNSLNETRAKVMEILAPILIKKGTVSEFIEGLYEFIINNDIENKLRMYADDFANQNLLEKAKEYSQVYKKIVGLLDQMHELLPDEPLSITEFTKIFDSGVTELDIGTIPGGVDRVIVGDIERSRIGKIKILFFLGVNDGAIPKGTGNGGILSDMDREFLKEAQIELSPTPRDQIFSQRLYLYLTLTKPSEHLYISYSRNSLEQKPLKESYLVDMIRRMFPNTNVADKEEDFAGIRDAASYMSSMIRRYSDGLLDKNEVRNIAILLRILLDSPATKKRVQDILEAGFYDYKENAISKEVARKIYGEVLSNSVSRLERFSSCQYAHFLTYGMGLFERDEQDFHYNDLGNIYHYCLEEFSKTMQMKGYTLRDYPEEELVVVLDEILERIGVEYKDAVLHKSYSNEYKLGRIRLLLERTLKAARFQLGEGEFLPEEFEYSFNRMIDISDETKMLLRGKIDRVDICKKDDKVYVKILDYKSGNKDIELDSLLYGLQLQQPVYMKAALKEIGKRYEELLPTMSAMLYMHIDNPVINAEREVSDEDILNSINKVMCPTGLVLNEEDNIINLDSGLKEAGSKSSVIPVDKKSDGDFTKASKLISKEDYELISEYVDGKIVNIGRDILNGKISINPKIHGDVDSCKYCEYKDICSFDTKIAGYQKTYLKSLSKDEALEKMREEVEKWQ